MHAHLLLFLFLSLVVALSSAQFYFHQPATYQPQVPQALAQPQIAQYAHPDVINNAARESQLPPELLKSDRFYKNPRIAAGLAKQSWFTDKEMPVIDREASKIPRDMVYKLFKNAGFIKRR